MLTQPTGRLHLVGALGLAVAMALVVGIAIGFEVIGGFIPCALCLEQRQPYYAAIPVALLAAVAAGFDLPSWIVRGALMITGLVMAYGLYLAIFHAGVEWAFWQGPADCAVATQSGVATEAGDLLGALDTVTPPACDEAAGRFLGLSFAGWNAIASLPLALAAFWLATRPAKAG